MDVRVGSLRRHSTEELMLSNCTGEDSCMLPLCSMVKNPPAMQKTWVQFLGWEDPLEKGMATHSNILARIIPWTEEPGRLQSMVSQKS